MRILRDPKVRSALAFVGLAFVAWTLARSDYSSLEIRRSSVPFLIGAVALLSASTAGAAATWVMLTGEAFARSGLAYLRAVPAKHIPGGFGLPAAQVNHGLGEGRSAAETLFLIVAQVAISLVSVGIILFAIWQNTDLGASVLVVAILLVGVPLFGASLVPRIWTRFRVDNRPTIPIRRLIGAVMITGVSLLCMGWAFLLIVRSLDGGLGASTSVSVFLISWTAGLLALPVPGGIGVREAVLVSLVPSADVAIIVGASVAFRIVSVIAELLVSSTAYSIRPEGRGLKELT